MNAKISIIVPLKYATGEFDKNIQSLLSLDYPDFDIIIADDGLAQIPPAIADHHDKITLVQSGSKGPSHARNVAARRSSAEYLAFTDSDCLVAPDWLNELMAGFRAFPQAAACGGSQAIPSDASWFEKKVFAFLKKMGHLSEYVKQDVPHIKCVRHNASCNVMYKRDIFLKEKGFLEGLWPGEDVEFDYRLIKKGYTLVYNPKALVYHYRPKKVTPFCLMMYRYGLAQAILLKKYGFFRKIQAVPLVSVLLLVLLCALFLVDKTIGFGLSLFLLVAFFMYFFDAAIIFLAAIAGVCWHWGFLVGLARKDKKE